MCKLEVDMQREREGKLPAQESIEVMMTETQSAMTDGGPTGRHSAS